MAIKEKVEKIKRMLRADRKGVMLEYRTGLEGRPMVRREVVACPVLGARVSTSCCARCEYFGASQEMPRGRAPAKKVIVCLAPRPIIAEQVMEEAPHG